MLTIALWSMLFLASATSADLIEHLPVPSDATAVRRNPPNQRGAGNIRFDVVAKPAGSLRVEEFYARILTGRGWRQCKTPTMGWTDIVDDTQTPPAMRHFRGVLWVNGDTSELLEISEEAVIGKSQSLDSVPEATQHVHILVIDSKESVSYWIGVWKVTCGEKEAD